MELVNLGIIFATLSISTNCLKTWNLNWKNTAPICNLNINRTELDEQLDGIAYNKTWDFETINEGIVEPDNSYSFSGHEPTVTEQEIQNTPDGEFSSNCNGTILNETQFSIYTREFWIRELDKVSRPPDILEFRVLPEDRVRVDGNVVLANKAAKITFSYNVVGKPTPHVVLMEDFNEMGPTGDYKRNMDAQQFELRKPLKTFNKYRIKAFNRFGVAYSKFIEVHGVEDRDPTQVKRTLNLHDSVKLPCGMKYIPPMAKVGFKKTSGSNPFESSQWFAFVDTDIFLIRVNYSLQSSFVCFTEVPPCCGNTRAKHSQYIFKIQNSTISNNNLWKIKRLHPESTGESTSVKAALGEKLKFACVYGYPARLDLYWTTPRDLDNLTLVSRQLNNRFIVIDKVEQKHAGRYTCYAEADGQKAYHHYNIELFERPYWRSPLENHTVDDEATDVVFNCNVGGKPKVKIEWYINGTVAKHHVLYNQQLVKIDGSKLTFTKVSEKTRLMVQCNASNEYGYIYTNGYLRVLQLHPIKWATNLPQIARAVEKQTFICGSNVFGSPMPNVTFYKYPDGEKFDPKAREDKYIIGTQNQIGCKLHNKKYWSCIFNQPNYNYSMAVQDLEIADAGIYISFFDNKYGNSHDMKTLRVFNKTSISLTNLTTSKIIPKQFITYEDDSLEVKCSATIDKRIKSELEVTWYVERDDGSGEIKKELASSTPGVIVDTKNKDIRVLKFPKIQTTMSGVYTCEGKTELDSESKSFKIIVHGRPDAPKEISEPECLDGRKPSIYLREGNENGDPIKGYEVEMFLTAKCCSHYKRTSKVNITSTQIKPIGIDTVLDASFKYEWDIRAINKYGKSEPVRVTCQTIDDVPEASPTNVCAVNSPANTINITWTPIKIDETNGHDFAYHIQLSDSEDNLPPAASVANFAEKSRVFKKVKPFHKYIAKVTSKNNIGSHIHSLEYAVRSGEGVPPNDISVSGVKLLDKESIDNIKISFDAIANTLEEADKLMNGYLNDYLVVVKYKNKDLKEQHFIISKGRKYEFCKFSSRKRARRSSKRETDLLRDLQPFEEATIQVYARNLRGDRGKGSDPISFRTPMGPPFGGKELEADCKAGFFHTECNVEDPKDAKRGGEGGKTKVCIRVEGQSGCVCEKEIEPDDKNFVCSDNVKNCTDYTIELTPFNVDGNLKIEGATTVKKAKTSCGSIILKKPKADYQEEDATSVKVNWKFDDSAKGVEPTHFRVEFYNELHTNSSTPELNKTELIGFEDHLIIRNLEEDEPYIGYIIGMLGPTTNGAIDESTSQRIKSDHFKFHTGTRSKYKLCKKLTK
ncbi:DgyrCDS4994 [Dimorphilus gyrociliatus]|uniref:DgyrCDS4994 n=2 Tax=Dimorphilus gyrociliatus TaxID=2664684 RepID=A0A7I8VIM3_9ANNE|nr:DgyrCDS4994 [Dimorphilus gyrociliatus]